MMEVGLDTMVDMVLMVRLDTGKTVNYGVLDH